MRRHIPAMLVLSLSLSAASVSGQQHQHHGAAKPNLGVPLFDDLGNHHYGITTSSDSAQRYFDQGMRLIYAFNHGEAIRAFDEAARLDPNCAMCYWGTALALGPHVNAAMDSAAGARAYATVKKALAAPGASERERTLIRALAKRYAPVPPADRAALDSAYARAMGEVAARYPDDLDVATLYAEALMDLSPWNYWDKGPKPRPDTPKILTQLERVLERNPNHPGACHYYIHAVEAAYPKRAVPCAERLTSLMPGAGHIVHMPAHIYIRTGRWNDAIVSNRHAVHTDETYIADQRPEGVYPGGYYPHNYHFLAFAATMAGRSAEAIAAARSASQKVPVEVARQVLEFAGILPYHHLALIRFGRWNEVLRMPLPPADIRLASGLAHYARGVALAAKGRWDKAETAHDTVRQIAAAADSGLGQTVLQIADHALAGEIASRRGSLDAAADHFRAAMELEDRLPYFEPPFWYYPIRHSLGAVLLKAERAAEAEAVYREDLKRFPENGWSLYGLARSLRAQNKTAEAAEVEERLKKAWEHADVKLTASRF